MRTSRWLLVSMLALLVFASLPALANQYQAPMDQSAVPSWQASAPLSQPYLAPAQVYPAPVVQGALPVNLVPFLQAEVNEVAMLSAQSNHLRQQGDALGADLVASYIPDHQLQISRLQFLLGPQSMAIQPTEAPFLGTRAQIINHDRVAHSMVQDQYRTLLGQTVGFPVLHQVALLGLNGASRHFDSLTVARAVVEPTPQAQQEGLLAAVRLEKSAVADLLTQSQQLQAQGDFQGADLLLSQVPAHQQQLASLINLAPQYGVDPTFAVPTLVPPLSNPAEIQTAQRVSDIQMASTYALPIALLPPSPERDIALRGQQIALQGLSVIGPTGFPVA